MVTTQATLLNKALGHHVAGRLLSQYGARMFFAEGIVAQTEQSQHAKIKATAGMAFHHGIPLISETMDALLPTLTPQEIVAYAPVAGVKALREEWKAHICKRNPSLNKDAITTPIVMSGLTHGISAVLSLMLDPTDTLITPDFYWENYKHIACTSIGASLSTFPLFDDNNTFNIHGFERAIQQSVEQYNKAVFLLNFPNNPTGYSLSTHEVDALVAVIYTYAQKGASILSLVDDAYFGFLYQDDLYKESLFSKLADVHENVLAAKIDGATKELLSWGLRVGFVTFGNKNMNSKIEQVLAKKLSGHLRATITSSSRISQTLLYKTLTEGNIDHIFSHTYTLLQARYVCMQQEIEQAVSQYPDAGLVPIPCNSGYFISFTCKHASAVDIQQSLLEQESIALIHIGNTLRFTFATIDIEIIPDIIQKIFKCASSLHT